MSRFYITKGKRNDNVHNTIGDNVVSHVSICYNSENTLHISVYTDIYSYLTIYLCIKCRNCLMVGTRFATLGDTDKQVEEPKIHMVKEKSWKVV
jgi:hypothetical protein